MRLIDADELKKHATSWMTTVGILTTAEIDNAPTINPEDIRPKGKWFELVESIPDHHTGEYYEEVYYNCTVCDYATADKTKFCPNCGAKMEG